MAEMGLGCAKTPAPAAHVQTSRRNCAPWSRIVLRARCSIPCWRIVFSTFRNCMSFHTGWVNRVGPTQPTASPDVRFTSNSVRISAGHGTDGKYQKRTHAPQQTDGMGQAYSITSSARARSIGERATEKVLG